MQVLEVSVSQGAAAVPKKAREVVIEGMEAQVSVVGSKYSAVLVNPLSRPPMA
jgi:hypothetical protein